MKSTQHAFIISLLQEGYSDKENNKGGHPSKLTAKDKQAIICQITTGKLDNAIQATHYINNVITSPVCPQTVRNALKENNLRSVVKSKHPLLKAVYYQSTLSLLKHMQNGL